MQVMTLEHWLQVLSYRDSEWPQGLCGSFPRDEELEAFRKLFAFLDEQLESSELQVHGLWDVELLPVQGGLAAPAAVPLRELEGPAWAWEELSEALPLLDAALPLGRFVRVATTTGEEEVYERLARVERWPALAVLQQRFLQGRAPLEGWRAYGDGLRLPCRGGSAPVAHCVCGSLLGARVEAELPRPWRFLDTRRWCVMWVACCSACEVPGAWLPLRLGGLLRCPGRPTRAGLASQEAATPAGAGALQGAAACGGQGLREAPGSLAAGAAL